MANQQQKEFQQQHYNNSDTITLVTLQPKEQQNNACMYCLEEKAVGYPVQEFATLGEVVQRPEIFPENICCDRIWFLMCMDCFLKLATIGTTHPSTLDWEDNHEENESIINSNDDFDSPLTNPEALWGVWREQKFDDFLQELSNMLPTNTSGVVDFNVLGDSFWNDQNFRANLEQQWNDEISELERTITEFHSDIDYSS